MCTLIWDSKTPLQSFTAWRNYKTPDRSWTEPKKKQYEYENDPPHHWNVSVPLVRGIFCFSIAITDAHKKEIEDLKIYALKRDFL